MNKERLLKMFLELVRIDSETTNERAVADYVKAKLQQLGFEVKEDNAGAVIGGSAGNVIAYKAGTIDGANITFCAHMDTVAPGCGIEPVINGNIITSKGNTVLGGDDKAGIAAIIEAVETMIENGEEHGPIQIVFTIAEEGGLRGAKNIDLHLLHQPIRGAYFFDTGRTSDHIVVQAPYQISFKATFKGKASHAGVAPEKGISAIQMTAEAINQMKLGRIDEETTANIGVIQGGKVTNIIPETVEIKGECRSLDKDKVEMQKAHMIDCCQKAADKFGGTVELEAVKSYDGILLTPDMEVIRLVSKAVENLGLTPKLIKNGGGSDASIFNGYGIASTVVGVGMTNAHSVDESIKISDIELAVQVIGEIIKEGAK